MKTMKTAITNSYFDPSSDVLYLTSEKELSALTYWLDKDHLSY